MAERPGCGAGAEDRPAGVGDRFFEGVLAAHRRAADLAGIEWKSAVYGQIEEESKLDQGLTIASTAKLGHVSRAGYYRFGVEALTPVDPDMDLRDAIQPIALQWPSYGRHAVPHSLFPALSLCAEDAAEEMTNFAE
jgi:hypothetical protein